ncbi:MAG: hypothetical protein ACOYEC_00715 [Christensenellales bacterium]|jgi:hypothetical protein|nr:hypothetical protein [Clostridiales bacterium]
MGNYSQLGTKKLEMTNYDIFMLNKNKKKAECKLFDRRESPVEISYENYKKKFAAKEEDRPCDSYKDYLIKQLERSTPERILTEEEFYGGTRAKAKKTFPKERIRSTKDKNDKPSAFSAFCRKIFGNVELKKGAKIFIVFYVLIVIAIASILIVMNTSSPISSVSADASGENIESEGVQPMVLQQEENDNRNWFDKLCDSLNK